MRIVVPYRPGMLLGRTYDAARSWPGGAEFVELRNDDEPRDDRPTYHELLARLWRVGDGVIILEQDVMPFEDTFEQLVNCAEPWCGFCYQNGGGHSNLGCTKLSADVIAAIPDLWERGRAGWRQCDSVLAEHTEALTDMRWHRHLPDVEHRGGRRGSLPATLEDEHVELDADGQPLQARAPHAPLRRREAPATLYESREGWSPFRIAAVQPLAPSVFGNGSTLTAPANPADQLLAAFIPGARRIG